MLNRFNERRRALRRLKAEVPASSSGGGSAEDGVEVDGTEESLGGHMAWLQSSGLCP